MVTAKRLFLATVMLLMLAITATPANNAEELIFSTSGATMALEGNTKATTTAFGFWIWCAVHAAGGSKGGYQNFSACQGSMYFYALDHNAEHVIDNPALPLTEPTDGFYVVNVEQGTP